MGTNTGNRIHASCQTCQAQEGARILDVDAPADLWAAVDGFCCRGSQVHTMGSADQEAAAQGKLGNLARSCLRTFTSRRLFSSPDTLPNLSSATEAQNSNPNWLWHPAVRPAPRWARQPDLAGLCAVSERKLAVDSRSVWLCCGHSGQEAGAVDAESAQPGTARRSPRVR